MRGKLSFVGLFVAALSTVSCGSDSDGAQTGLDGVWDITSYNTGGPAEMVISGGSLTGYVANAREGKPNFHGLDDCTATKDRTEFTITAAGNSVTATRTAIIQTTGSSCEDYYKDYKRTVTFSGVRTRTAPASSTDLNGDWSITGEGDAWDATVNGYAVTAKSKPGPKRPDANDEDTLNIAIAGGVITVSSTEEKLGFAAKKR
ncbi:hypothetical protein LVJ94_44445 [Pendulispora rubella]|uniref:Lipocalin-like domain-containing protein n=1 Tax=Pendulispora rubella TaxID=2741070 RepID=A0ABZ2L2D1_9BACT